jgi:RHS repeat-associated protein
MKFPLFSPLGVLKIIFYCFAITQAGGAPLLKSVFFDRQLLAFDRTPGRNPRPENPSDVFSGGSFPASDSLFIEGFFGSTMTTTYSFSDDGNSAEIDIDSKFAVYGYDGIDEKSPTDQGIWFDNTRPVRYKLSIERISAPGIIGIGSSVYVWNPTGGFHLEANSENTSVSTEGETAHIWGLSPGIGAAPYLNISTGPAEQVVGSVLVRLVLTAIPNSPPILSDIPDQTALTRKQLAFTATAADTGTFPNNLGFSLEKAPAGATVDQQGTFRWTPTDSQAFGTYQVTMRVTDDGVPPMSDSKSFVIKVCEELNNQTVCEKPIESHKNDGQKDGPGSCCVGLPIDVGTGNMFEKATDIQSATEPSLSFVRYYNSLAAPDAHASLLGGHWRSGFDRYLKINTSNGVPSQIIAERANGQMLTFMLQGAVWVSDSDVDLRLERSDTAWQLTDSDDTLEFYSPVNEGVAFLSSIRLRGGYTETLHYDANNHLSSVMDSFGRSLQFTFAGNLLKTLTGPDQFQVSYSYDSSGSGEAVPDRLAAVSYSTQPQTGLTYVYDSAVVPFALSAIIDEKKNYLMRWSYDGQGRGLVSELGDGSEHITVSYNDIDSSRTVTNPLGEIDIYRFVVREGIPKASEINRLATSNSPTTTALQAYDSNGYLASKTDWNGNVTRFENDNRGQRAVITEAAGSSQERVTHISYHERFHLPLRIVAPGKTTDFVYDDKGNLLTRTETDTTAGTVPYSTGGQTRSWHFTWNEQGQMLTSTGPRTDITATTAYHYATNGTLSISTDALGHATRFTSYNERGLPLMMIDANGTTNVFNYDRRDRILTQSVGDAETRFLYDAAEKVTSIRLPDGMTLYYQYDQIQRLAAMSNSLGERITYTRDAAGNITNEAVQSVEGNIIKTRDRVFDQLGRLVNEIGGAGQKSSFSYDGIGNQTATEDGLHRVTGHAFDALNRLVSIIDPLKNPVGEGYDAQDNLISVTDPRALTTRYIRNGFGQVIQEVSPDKGITVYRLDEAGNRISETDARGVVMQRTFDKLNRVTTETFPGLNNEKVTFTYDSSEGENFAVGRLTSYTDETGSTALRYDPRGNLIKLVSIINDRTSTVSYGYDLGDRVVSMIYPSGHVIQFARDNQGRIATVRFQSFLRAVPVTLATNITYLPFGPLASLIYGNGLVRTNVFDRDYRLAGIATRSSTNSVQNLQMSYDEANNIISIIDLLDPSRNQNFAYDELSRLTHATGAYGMLDYGYDRLGNRLSETINGVTNIFAYPADANRLDSVTGEAISRKFTYTQNGNVATDDRGSTGLFHYDYNRRNRLQTLTVNGKPTATYGYNALGQRLVKTVGNTNIYFHYDRQSHLIAETDGYTGAMLREYVWLDDFPLAQIESSGTIYFIHPDHLNTPQKTTDATANVVWDRQQKPFGETISIEHGEGAATLTPAGFTSTGQFQLKLNVVRGSIHVIQASSELNFTDWVSIITNSVSFTFIDSNSSDFKIRFYRTVVAFMDFDGIPMNLRFSGQYFDREAGLNYNGTRDFEPFLGRYIEPDKIGLNGGINLFSYVKQNPILQIDPLGLEVTEEQIGNIIFNETRSFSGENLASVRYNIAQAIINGDREYGDKRPQTAPTTATVPDLERTVYGLCREAAKDAKADNSKGIDPTDGATHFNFRNNSSQKPFYNYPISTQVGPLNNSFTGKGLNASGVYGNTYGSPNGSQ